MQKNVVVYVGTGKLVAMLGDVSGEEAHVERFEQLRDPEGFRRGFVTDVDKAANSLQSVLERLVPGVDADDISCHVVLGNSKLKTYHFSSSQYFQGTQRTVTPYDVRSIVSQTRSIATLPLSEIVLQAIPESFLVNDMQGIRNPLGLDAQRLGVELKIFTMAFQDFKNIHRVFESLDIDVVGFFPKTLTISEAILSEQEKNEGVLIFDIAEDVTHLVLWKNGCIADTRSISIGGSFLSERLADQWEIDAGDARKAKEQYGTFLVEDQFSDELIPLVERNGQRTRNVHRGEFQTEFVRMGKQWLESILQKGREFADEHSVRYPHYAFTGGGTRIDHFIEFLQNQFSIYATLGVAKKIEAPNELLVDPSLVGGLGMYRWLVTEEREHRKLVAPQNFVEKTLSSAKNWFSAYF